MNYKIIADSCCDVTPKQCEDLGITIIPLSLTLDGKSYTDDEKLDLPKFMEDMKNCTGRIGSASPSPVLYKEAFQGTHTSFVVTLSKNLSGSYASAMLGKEMAEEEGADVHVFDSKSACAAEALVALKISKLISAGFQKEKIISYVENFISEMKTYFVLESIDNLLKNGRMSKITGKIISVLNIKPIMGADKDGQIALYSHARGQQQIIDKLADTIEKSGKDVEGESVVIAHCNNPGLAEKLMDAIKKRYRCREIFIVPTRGVSTIYANDKGVVLAF